MVNAEIVQILETLGVKGVRRVRCRITDGPDKGRVITRNVSGPINIGDIVVLKDTTMDSETGFQR